MKAKKPQSKQERLPLKGKALKQYARLDATSNTPNESNRNIDTVRKDDWMNILTGLGVSGMDKSVSNTFRVQRLMSYTDLSNLYLGEGMAKRIVDLIPDEMTRQWFTIPADTDGAIIEKMQDLNLKAELTNMLTWARLYGGCLAILGIDDGGELTDPVNEENIKDVNFIHLFDRFNVFWNTSDLYQDIDSPKYGTPEYYNVTPYHGGPQFQVHESRCLIMQGELLPTRLMLLNQGWGSSVLQSCFAAIRNLASGYNSCANIIQDFVQTTIKVQNLADLVASGRDDLIVKRLQLLDTSRSVANTIILDSLEEYSKEASSVSGIGDLLEHFALALSSHTGIPYTLLMGQSPAGLTATGDSDIRLFYDKIRSKQESELQPCLERVAYLIMKSSNGPTNGQEIDGWKIEFNPLWQMSASENAAYRLQIAQADQIYLSAGVLDPSEVAYSRFGSGVFSPETVIDMDNRAVSDIPDNEVADLKNMNNNPDVKEVNNNNKESPK